jgi:predicted ATPase
MYLSKLKIKNYRSVKELDLEFKKGKNVIVGKNNSGKSNLIRAIDLLLGENSPTYHKSENITDNDFNQGDTTQPIFIFCELTREANEGLDYNAIYNCFGYYYHSKIDGWTRNDKGKSVPVKSPILHNLREDLRYFWDDLDAIMNIDEDDNSVDEHGQRLVDKEYVNPKLRNQGTFEGQLDNKHKFAFAFRATKLPSKIEKEIRFLYRENDRNQVIVTTHSNEFVNTAHEQLNIIVVRKEDTLGTIATCADFLKSKDKQILLRSQNSEMFFADRVILVEGGDKFILESIAQKFGGLSWGIKRRSILGDAWLNDNNISIISVGGKTEFWKYRNKLDELRIPNLVLADFDFFLRQLSEFATKLKWTEADKNKLNTLKGKLGDVQGVKRFSQLVSNQKEVQNYLRELKISRGIFVLSGELEDFFTRNCMEGLTGMSLGKEEKAIHVVSNMVNDQTGIDTLVNCDEYYDILSSCVT